MERYISNVASHLSTIRVSKMTNSSKFLSRLYLTCIALLIVQSLQNGSVWSIITKSEPVCTTPDCKKLSDIYLKSMNSRASPCENFYDYVCGNWAKQHPRPFKDNLWFVGGVLKNKVVKEMQEMMEKPFPESTDLMKKAVALYKACMDLPILTTTTPKALKDIMAKVGNWPMFLPKNKEISVPWWQIDNAYSKVTGESAFFEFKLKAEHKEHHIIPILTIPASPHGMIIRKFDYGYFSKEREHYKNFLMEVVKTVAPQDPALFKGTIDKDINNVIDFREKMIKVLRSTYNSSINTVTIGAFQKVYDTRAGSSETAQVDWLKKISSLHKNGKNSYGSAFTKASVLEIKQDYFLELSALLAKTPKRVIANHIHLYFAERHILLHPELEELLNKSLYDGGALNGDIRYKSRKETWCIDTNNMRDTLGKMYLRVYFSPEDKNIATALFNDARRLFKRQIIDCKWLDDDTKLKSVNKVTYMNKVIGYPDWYHHNTTTKVTFDPLIPDILSADTYYHPSGNTLYIAASYLQLPVYSSHVPYVIDYGSLVSLIGHELYHSVGTYGMKFDHNGETPWWPKPMVDEYLKRAQCFKDHYAKYKVVEKTKERLGRWSFTADTTEEDIADAMGLQLAYTGFKEKLMKSNGTCHILPGFEKFGCEKLFFIAYANNHCVNLTPDGNRLALMYGLHSLPHIRINGAVANLKAFSDAFGCKPTDPLRLEKTCNLWKN